jgi:glucose/arabinose dehydrogenase
MIGMCRTARRSCALGSVVVVALLSVGAPLAAQTLTDPTLTVTQLTTPGLAAPTSVDFLAPGDILVLEKETGQVRRVLNDVLQGGNVLDVHVNFDSERGLLGIAINSQSPPQVFLYYTEASGMDGGTPLGNRVYRYTWNAGLGVLQSPQLILALPVTAGPNHAAGWCCSDRPAPGPSPTAGSCTS